MKCQVHLSTSAPLSLIVRRYEECHGGSTLMTDEVEVLRLLLGAIHFAKLGLPHGPKEAQ